jgi:hypothetical protein
MEIMTDDWDKRSLRLTEPCKECPFRKQALPGYLGGHRLESYRQPPSAGMPTSCHCSDKGAGDPRTSYLRRLSRDHRQRSGRDSAGGIC